MKLIFTDSNRPLVGFAKNMLVEAGITVTLKNEFPAHGIRAFDDWLEIWLVDESDTEKANKIIESLNADENSEEWICGKCNEKNAGSFDLCWNCQADKP